MAEDYKKYIPLLRQEGIPEKGIKKFLWEQKASQDEWPEIRPPLSGLSKEASEFLRKFAYILRQYSPPVAKAMFQEDYGLLKQEDKFELNNYLGIGVD